MGETEQLRCFYRLSATLTGFDETDLLATGVGQEYYQTLVEAVGYDQVEALMSDAQAAVTLNEFEERIWRCNRFGPLARSIVVLWYLGNWEPLPVVWLREVGEPHWRTSDLNLERVVSTRAYTEGLDWQALGVNPPGSKPPGYGAWATPPSRR